MREITDVEVREILSLRESDITQRKLVELFAATRKGDSKYETNDRFTLPAGRFHNKQTIETTIGRYIFNMFALPEAYLKKYGYANMAMHGGAIGDEESLMANMLLSGELKAEDYLQYMRKGEWLAGAVVAYLAPSFDQSTVDTIPEIMVRKEQLAKEYADKIAQGDMGTISMINDKLVAEADAIMRANPEKYKTIEWANARVYNIGNNYRKTNISTGLQRKPSNQDEYFYIDSNYAEGLAKKDYATNSNLAIIGGLSRGLDSAESGYSAKKILGAMSTWEVDKDLDDCGTKHYLETEIPKGYGSFYLYRWVNDGDTEVLLDPNNINRYLGKTIKLRSPLYCKSEKVCNKCAGDFLDRIGVGYEGLAAFEIADVLVNQQMKAFHDSSIKSSNINPFDYIKKIS